MSLLSICQNVAAVAPIAIPSAVAGSPDATAQMLFALANEAGNSLNNKPDGGWVNTIREFDFVTSSLGPLSGTVNNTGPGGVARITGLSSTTGLAGLTWYVTGTTLKNNSIIATVDSPSQVTLNQAASLTGATAGSFSFGKSDYALPSDFRRPVDNTFWDRSRFWSMRGPLSPQQWQLYKSSVIGKASIQRRFRFRYIGNNKVLSIDPTPFDNGSQLVFEYVSNSWCQSQAGSPQIAWVADTDTGILDEYLLQLGLKWRLLRRLGMSYDEELSEYENEASKAMATDGGAAILDMTPANRLTLIGPWNLPETNFGNVAGS